MKLSIITINFNNYDGLKRTMDSVFFQTFKDFEWIVVDGGSTDGSKDLLSSHGSEISQWVSEPDSGIYNAMNKGIRMSHGDYLLFLNSGDSLTDESVLERSVHYLSDTDYVIGNIVHTQRGDKTGLTEKSFSPGGLLYILINYALPHPASFMRRSLFEQYGFYREDLRISSDWAFMVYSILLGKATVKYLPVVVTSFDDTGISSVNLQEGNKERDLVMQERPILFLMRDLLDFHLKNYEAVDTLKSGKLFYQIFRFYSFFRRKTGKRKIKSILSKYNFIS